MKLAYLDDKSQQTNETYTGQSHTTHEVQVVDGLFGDRDHQLSILRCHRLQGPVKDGHYA